MTDKPKNVFTLGGGEYKEPPKDDLLPPNKDVIETLEELLAEAKKGEIQELCYVTVDRESFTKYSFLGVIQDPYRTHSALVNISLLYRDITGMNPLVLIGDD